MAAKWHSLAGVLCDKAISEHLKAKVYRTVVRPVATYGAECWSVTEEIENHFSVMETKILRWTAEVTRLDRVRNETIRQRFGIARYPTSCARLVYDGTATSFALTTTPSVRLARILKSLENSP
ncbi:unnamed protein product [Heligmosomoides polygyrus]|uniref:Uncharacterized protein n=1 Tax=Heligmosomoides polygyrus TaxID=6339 RepID=A0A183F7J0_HELPZ|nr:unnamed protein product [Heligmosomoides polygyrus]